MVNISATERPAIYPLCEYALTVEFGNSIDERVLGRVTGFNKLLLQNPFPGLYQTVPAYASLSVFFEPLTVIRQDSMQGIGCFDKVCNYLRRLNSESEMALADTAANVISIPVCYGLEYGPDIAELAETRNLPVDKVINLHSAATYTVFMIGFVPGFAYLGGLDPLLESPRKATPRAIVPAGSVGIAGGQTGIYPLATPGGWQLIGRTPLKLFDATRPQPSLLKAGDKVKFEPILAADFKNYSAR